MKLLYLLVLVGASLYRRSCAIPRRSQEISGRTLAVRRDSD